MKEQRLNSGWDWLVVRPSPKPLKHPKETYPAGMTENEMREMDQRSAERVTKRVAEWHDLWRSVYLSDPRKRAKYDYRQRQLKQRYNRGQERHADDRPHWEQDAVDGADLPAHLPPKDRPKPCRCCQLAEWAARRELLMGEVEQDMELDKAFQRRERRKGYGG